MKRFLCEKSTLTALYRHSRGFLLARLLIHIQPTYDLLAENIDCIHDGFRLVRVDVPAADCRVIGVHEAARQLFQSLDIRVHPVVVPAILVHVRPHDSGGLTHDVYDDERGAAHGLLELQVLQVVHDLHPRHHHVVFDVGIE